MPTNDFSEKSGEMAPANVLVVAVETPETPFTDYDCAELCNLIETAGGTVVSFIKQKREDIDSTTAVGSGKLDELKNLVQENPQIDLALFNNKMNALQRRNVSKALGVNVIDRIDLILDIFALHAKSNAGKKQVQLAQLTYAYATKNENVEYSRQGGGIGTRGPGETKLETNKRVMREKISRLKAELKEIEKLRKVTGKLRKETGEFCVALVGYTNAGKSTLFNRICDENVYADDKLFATLDTTTRKVCREGLHFLLSDTVGFIKDLPHQLIEAFKATLDEATEADLIVNVCDASSPEVETQIEVTEKLLEELGVVAPIIRVYNKMDLLPELPPEGATYVSAKTGENVEDLIEKIMQRVKAEYITLPLSFAYSEYAEAIKSVNKYGQIVSGPEYGEDCVTASVRVLKKYAALFGKYVK